MEKSCFKKPFPFCSSGKKAEKAIFWSEIQFFGNFRKSIFFGAKIQMILIWSFWSFWFLCGHFFSFLSILVILVFLFGHFWIHIFDLFCCRFEKTNKLQKWVVDHPKVTWVWYKKSQGCRKKTRKSLLMALKNRLEGQKSN